MSMTVSGCTFLSLPRTSSVFAGSWLIATILLFTATIDTVDSFHQQLYVPLSPSPSETKLYVKSKPPRTSRSKDDDDDDDPTKVSSWIALKKLVYDGVDGVSSILPQMDTDRGMDKNVQKGRVFQGYDSSLEATVRSRRSPMTTAERILMIEQFGGGNVRQGAGVTSIQQRRQEERERREKISSFDNFKLGVYNILDFVTGPAPTRPTKQDKEGNEGSESLPETTNLAVPSKPSMNQIREQEARARAEVRNEKIRAKKEDLYRIVDSLQATVDALPETFDAAEEAIKEAIVFSTTIPRTMGKTIQEIQAIPIKVKQQALATQRTIKRNAETTKKVVQDVQDIPNKVNRSVETTKQAIANSQETVLDVATSVKVLMGLEKATPKPPKRPPPPEKTPKEIAMDLAGKAAGVTGKLAWWTGKNAALLAWKGARVVYIKSVESIGPAIVQAMKQEEQQVSKVQGPKPPATRLPPESTMADIATDNANVTTSNTNTSVKAIKTPEELAREIAEAQALAKEVEEALVMAERALLISAMDETTPVKIKK
jgi:hypothetical protein